MMPDTLARPDRALLGLSLVALVAASMMAS